MRFCLPTNSVCLHLGSTAHAGHAHRHAGNSRRAPSEDFQRLARKLPPRIFQGHAQAGHENHDGELEWKALARHALEIHSRAALNISEPQPSSWALAHIAQVQSRDSICSSGRIFCLASPSYWCQVDGRMCHVWMCSKIRLWVAKSQPHASPRACAGNPGVRPAQQRTPRGHLTASQRYAPGRSSACARRQQKQCQRLQHVCLSILFADCLAACISVPVPEPSQPPMATCIYDNHGHACSCANLPDRPQGSRRSGASSVCRSQSHRRRAGFDKVFILPLH